VTTPVALAATIALLLTAGCTGGVRSGRAAVVPPATPTAAPSRDPSRDSLALTADIHLGASGHTWQGADDHLTLAVENRGRDIQDVVVVSPPWVAEHGLGMGTTRSCDPDLDAGLIACGPIYAGQSMAIILRGFPNHAGTFKYDVAVYDRENGRLVPISGVDGQPADFTFTEVVDPLTNQVPGGSYPPPSPPAG
jgi:hypothetical protein